MGTYKTQSRKLSSGPPLRLSRGYYAGNEIPWYDREYLPELGTTQTTESYRTNSRFESVDPLSPEGIADFTDVTRNGLFGEPDQSQLHDNGHPFFTTKTFNRFSHPAWRRHFPGLSGQFEYAYDGPLIPLNDQSSGYGLGTYPAVTRMSENTIKVKGAAAIANTAPTAPQVSLSTTIGELLSEGLPQLMGLDTLKNRGDRVRSSGGEYLNYEFGWRPLVSDVRKIAKRVAWSSQVIAQFERDGGKRVRRTFVFPDEVTEVPGVRQQLAAEPRLALFTDANYAAAFQPNRGGRKPGDVFASSTVSTRYKFKGSFQYAVIEGNTFADKLAAYEQKANILLGTRLTPEVLWNLSPWSWLADWVGNVGDVLANASYLTNDGLVMHYGYLMCHTVAINRYDIPDGARFTPGAETGPIYSIFGRETKERVRATPYGFGLKAEDFSLRQWAILGALGLTRSPKALWNSD